MAARQVIADRVKEVAPQIVLWACWKPALMAVGALASIFLLIVFEHGHYTPSFGTRSGRDSNPPVKEIDNLDTKTPRTFEERRLELENAADRGVPAAQWTLGRMYADGDGVPKDRLRAFEYFSRLTKAHGGDVPGTPQAGLVANAFVSLGRYYLDGIPNSAVKPDPDRAREMYWYAATYFADPDAQYNLGRIYLDRDGGARDPRQAAKWLSLAARKGHYPAQALLGATLVKGDGVMRQVARGLFWLTLAKDSAGPSETSITETYSNAFAQATESERAKAYKYLENWLQGQRD
jgi:uncharacterized protein